ncbi:hypothetical protein FDJ58_gp112 [Bacillus phage SIOphi]|uniref:Uncharacterized protein n=1 Tax=Bacillus phage SIOphi TaxID=1285382 RepID=R4JMQ2_9CAUD|nr:hypothetical protein FDJ58_gp112 [Bacillus phage SIOphi]AGK86920.1 hypothetical protein SIOphi_00560 [Bacillus phage SIOphi]
MTEQERNERLQGIMDVYGDYTGPYISVEKEDLVFLMEEIDRLQIEKEESKKADNLVSVPFWILAAERNVLLKQGDVINEALKDRRKHHGDDIVVTTLADKFKEICEEYRGMENVECFISLEDEKRYFDRFDTFDTALKNQRKSK